MMQCIRAINPRVKTVYMSGAVEQYRASLQRETEQFAASILPKPFSRHRLIKNTAKDNGIRGDPRCSGRNSCLKSSMGVGKWRQSVQNSSA
ncbi:MAG: hypothetical protein ACREX3_24025 [Gammaproteobacteria bacterium]